MRLIFEEMNIDSAWEILKSAKNEIVSIANKSKYKKCRALFYVTAFKSSENCMGYVVGIGVYNPLLKQRETVFDETIYYDGDTDRVEIISHGKNGKSSYPSSDIEFVVNDLVDRVKDCADRAVITYEEQKQVRQYIDKVKEYRMRGKKYEEEPPEFIHNYI